MTFNISFISAVALRCSQQSPEWINHFHCHRGMQFLSLCSCSPPLSLSLLFQFQMWWRQLWNAIWIPRRLLQVRKRQFIYLRRHRRDMVNDTVDWPNKFTKVTTWIISPISLLFVLRCNCNCTWPTKTTVTHPPFVDQPVTTPCNWQQRQIRREGDHGKVWPQSGQDQANPSCLSVQPVIRENNQNRGNLLIQERVSIVCRWHHRQ